MPANQITVTDSDNGVTLNSPGPQGRPGAVQSVALTSTSATLVVTGATIDEDNPSGTFNVELNSAASPTLAGLTLSGLTANTIIVANGSKALASQALTNGQLLIGSTGAAPVANALTAGTAISVTNGAGSITIANTGVTALAGTANQITASASTGSITLSLPSAITVPGSLAATTYVAGSVGTSLSAAGSNQGNATVLTKQINIVSTVGSGQGVVLPSFVGGCFIVRNGGANALSVYPPSGAAIDSLSTNAAFSLPVGAKIMFFQSSSTRYDTLNATYA